MIDIATTTPPNTANTSVLAMPFDWVLLAAPAAAQPWHDNSNLCAGTAHYTDNLPASYAFALEQGLHTAVIHSLFTDVRAGRDDSLPYNSTDKRGWVGESFVPNKKTGAYGSRLWLNYYVISDADGLVLEAQRFAAQESLAWLIDTAVVDAVEVAAQIINKETFDMLALHITMRRDGQASPIYDAIWGSTINQPEGVYAS